VAPSRLIAATLLLAAGCGRAPAPAPPAVALTRPVSSAALAVSPDGATLAAVNPDSDSVTLLDAATLAVRAELGVGADPRTLSFTPGGERLLVANHGAGTLSVIETRRARVVGEVAAGALPYGVVAGARRAYVSLPAPPRVAVVDLESLEVVAEAAVGPFPAGLALEAGEARLYVTHLYAGTVSVVDTNTLAVTAIPAPAVEANLAQFVALSPDGARAFLPQTYSFAGRLDLAYDNAVRPMVAVLEAETAAFAAPLDLAAIDRSVNLPFAAALSPDGVRLYVLNAGSDDVSVIDLASGQALGRLSTGRHPRGLALSPDGVRLYVNNTLDGTLDAFDTATFERIGGATLTTLALPPDVLAGKRLFNSSAQPMAADNWLSCATCHLDGGHDARTWAGFPDGPRNTPALFGTAHTLPLHWNGDLDEFADVEHTIRDIQGGAGLILGDAYPTLGAPNYGRSAEMDALAAYLASLPVPPSPYAPETEAERAAFIRGEHAFRRWGCAVCHLGAHYTDLAQHNTGIGDYALERRSTGPLPAFDTPTILGAWATAPYFHDGSAPNLIDTFFSAGFHNMGPAMDPREVEDLVYFMRALP
jgi:YVTN family beta-propeller protein